MSDESNGHRRIPISPTTAQMIVSRNTEIIDARQRLAVLEQRLADVLSSIFTENDIDPALTARAEITPEAPFALVLDLPEEA